MPASPLNPDNYETAFIQIADVLRRYESIWRAQPFKDIEPVWSKAYPNLFTDLLSLSDQALATLEKEDQLHAYMQAYLPELDAINTWTISTLQTAPPPMEKFADVGINGRKITQICGFSAVITEHLKQAKQHADSPTEPHKNHIIDWCSGKGHLAKQLHYLTGRPVSCLEYNAELCHKGQQAVEKLKYPISFIQHNVLENLPAIDSLKSTTLYTALHACGDLHLSLIKTAMAQRVQSLAWSPCCYHLTQRKVFEPQSQLGQQYDFQLRPQDLRLAVSQLVTGGNRAKKLRRQELLWRTAFDLWHRSLTGIDTYRPTPSVQKRWLSGSFETFCQFMAAQIGVIIPESLTIDIDLLLEQARQKLRRIERVEKAKLAFRSAMELYLILDQVLYLQEHNYRCDLRIFCPAHVTPRNIAILASQSC